MNSLNILAGTWNSRPVFSPRHMLCLLLTVYALIEFFPVNYTVSSIGFYAVLAISLAWLMMFPESTLVTRANWEPMLFFGIWLAYALLGYIWAADREMAVDNALLVFRYGGVFVIFDALFREQRILARAHLAMVLILILYVLIAFWEMLTFQHLPSSRYYGVDFYFLPTGPFYNQNNLAAFMLLIMPFMVFLPKLNQRAWLKPAVLIGSVILLVIFTVQGARIAMLAALGMLGFIGAFQSSFWSKISVLLMIILAVFAFIHFSPPNMQLGWKMLQRELNSFSTEAESAHMSSIKIRAQLVNETIDLAGQSAFMGLGGGNFEHYMNTDRHYRTAGIINAHNWFLEILGNYGILILAGFGYLYLRWLALLWSRYRSSYGRDKWLYLAYLWVLLLFIPASALPSSIRWNHHVWIIFAAINAMAHQTNPILRNNNA
ncbi:MAG: O-antigen ligase family protein [Candidatus Cloacimonadaceae bacterium]|jgi:teichuronic acid biosynthesis protein TuaE|nr:O-antigen ligase family protein [Candidatus Cloacimonadota bacterium]MDY0336563.1 O-antigen ligase family protein [Candidatus Cloacimonadaceae bacterium]